VCEACQGRGQAGRLALAAWKAAMDFWVSIGSTYSYLAVMRIADAA
jgi:hypothetical protein